MKEKTCGIVLGIINMVLLIVCGILFLGKDKNAPEILLSNVDFTYAKDAEQSDLFQWVTAIDKEDGELTDSVVIEKIVTDAEKGKATITYGVVDSAGNIGKVTCTVAMEVEETDSEKQDLKETNSEDRKSEEEVETESDSQEEESVVEENESEEGPEEDGYKEGDLEEEYSEDENKLEEEEAAEIENGEESSETEGGNDAEVLPTAGEAANRVQTVTSKQNWGRPTIVFRNQEVKVKAGESPKWVNVIEGLHDDKDNYETLLKSLKVSEYDKNKAGTYNVTLTVTDGEGNESNAYPIKIVVEAWE